jgi:hypothetical protein
VVVNGTSTFTCPDGIAPARVMVSSPNDLKLEARSAEGAPLYRGESNIETFPAHVDVILYAVAAE